MWNLHAKGCLLLHNEVKNNPFLDDNPLLVYNDCVIVLDDKLQVLYDRFRVLNDSGKG